MTLKELITSLKPIYMVNITVVKSDDEPEQY